MIVYDDILIIIQYLEPFDDKTSGITLVLRVK